MLIPNRLVQFLAKPKFYWLSTRNAEYGCELHRALGMQISGADSLCVFIPQGTGVRTRNNLLENKHFACSATCGYTFESYQFKGKMLEIRPAKPEEIAFIENYLSDVERMLVDFGSPEGAVSARDNYQPAWCIEFEVAQIFDQTPKMGTGKLVSAV